MQDAMSGQQDFWIGQFRSRSGGTPMTTTNHFRGRVAAIELTSPGRRRASPHLVIGDARSAHGF